MLIQVYLKAPRPGMVKTRLAQNLGHEEACRIYIQLVKRQLTALPRDAEAALHFAPADAAAEIRETFGDTYPLIPQSEGHLGDRLSNGIGNAFAQGASSVCVIGADCPDLQASHFLQADRLLQAGSDVVFGPARDGGYYLLALKQYVPELFRNIPWSTDRTLAASLAAAEKLNLKVTQLEMLQDVDQWEDWQQVAQRFS